MIASKRLFARLLIVLAMATAPWAVLAADGAPEAPSKYADSGVVTKKINNKQIEINDFVYNLSPSVSIRNGRRTLVLSRLPVGSFVDYTVVVLYGKHWIDTISIAKSPEV